MESSQGKGQLKQRMDCRIPVGKVSVLRLAYRGSFNR